MRAKRKPSLRSQTSTSCQTLHALYRSTLTPHTYNHAYHIHIPRIPALHKTGNDIPRCSCQRCDARCYMSLCFHSPGCNFRCCLPAHAAKRKGARQRRKRVSSSARKGCALAPAQAMTPLQRHHHVPGHAPHPWLHTPSLGLLQLRGPSKQTSGLGGLGGGGLGRGDLLGLGDCEQRQGGRISVWTLKWERGKNTPMLYEWAILQGNKA